MNLLLALKLFLISVFGFFFTLLVIIPVLSPFLFVFTLYYLLVKFILKLKYGDDVYKARATDVAEGRKTLHSIPIMNAAVRVSGVLNIEHIKEKILNMIENTRNSDGQKRYQRLKELYGRKYGYNVFMRYDEFDINNHVRLVHLDDEDLKADDKLQKDHQNLCNKNNNLELNKTDSELHEVSHQIVKDSNKNKTDETKDRFQLKLSWRSTLTKMMNKYGAEPFPAEHPPWNIIILDEGNGTYTAVFRFYHAISDGVFLSRMFAEDILDEPVLVLQSYKPPHKFIKWMRFIWSFCFIPFGLWLMISNTDRNPLHGPKLSGKKLFYMSNTVPLETFYLVKKKIKVTLHSIICSCISYAVSSHFARRGCSIRSVTTLTPLPLQNPRKQITLRNKFAIASMMLPTPPPQKNANEKSKITADSGEWHKQTTSLMRLTQVRATVEAMIKSPAILAGNIIVRIACSLLPEELVKILFPLTGCSMVISNLPGMKVQGKIWNGILVDKFFWTPDQDPLGVAFSVTSYLGKLRLGLFIDEALLPNKLEGDQIMDDFGKGLDHILQELQACQAATLEAECFP